MLRNIVVAALGLLLLAGPARGEDGRWLRAESPHFIVYSDGTDRELRDAVQHLENFDALLRQLLQPASDRASLKLEVYLLRSRSDLTRSLPEAGRSVAGYYAAQPGFIGAIALQGPRLRDFADEILLHEYAHHFMLNYFANAYPRWFVEGFAEFVATVEITDREVRLGAASAARVGILDANWPPMERVLDPGERDRVSMVGIYGVGWLATHYLIGTPGRLEQFGNYLVAMQSGADPVEAFEPAFGMTPRQFEFELLRYRRSGIQGFVLPRHDTPAAEVQVSRLSSAADELLPYVIQMRRAQRSESESEARRAARDRELIERIRRAAERYPGDPYARRALARAELLSGRFAEARALLAPMVGEGATDTEAMYLMGQSYVAEARAGETNAFTETAAPGRRYFARAFRIDSTHVPTLYAYAETYSATPGVMPDGPLDVLTQAHLLAPQVMEIRLRLGGELMRARRFDEAAPVLGPAAFSPHESALTRQARVLLEAARRGEQANPEALEAAAREPAD